MISYESVARNTKALVADRTAAIRELRLAAGKDSEGVLRDLLHDAAWMVRDAALSALVGPLGLTTYLPTALIWLREHPSACLRSAGAASIQSYLTWERGGGEPLLTGLVEAMLEEPLEVVRKGIWDTILRIKRGGGPQLGSYVSRESPFDFDRSLISEELAHVHRKGDWRTRVERAVSVKNVALADFVKARRGVWFADLAVELDCDVYTPQFLSALAPRDEDWRTSDWFGRVTFVRAIHHYMHDEEFSGRVEEARKFALDVWLSIHDERPWGIEAEDVRKLALERLTQGDWVPEDEEDDVLRSLFAESGWHMS